MYPQQHVTVKQPLGVLTQLQQGALTLVVVLVVQLRLAGVRLQRVARQRHEAASPHVVAALVAWVAGACTPLGVAYRTLSVGLAGEHTPGVGAACLQGGEGEGPHAEVGLHGGHTLLGEGAHSQGAASVEAHQGNLAVGSNQEGRAHHSTLGVGAPEAGVARLGAAHAGAWGRVPGRPPPPLSQARAQRLRPASRPLRSPRARECGCPCCHAPWRGTG